MPPIVREYFLLDTSDFIHCCTAIPQQPVMACSTKPLTACAPFEIQVLLPKSFMKAMFYSQARYFLLTTQFAMVIKIQELNTYNVVASV